MDNHDRVLRLGDGLLRCSGPWVIALAQRPVVGPARSILEKMYQKDVEGVGVKIISNNILYIHPQYHSFAIYSKKIISSIFLSSIIFYISSFIHKYIYQNIVFSRFCTYIFIMFYTILVLLNQLFKILKQIDERRCNISIQRME